MDKNELRAWMARNGDTNQTLARALGISAPSFSKKINAVHDFRQTEIQKIINRYNLSAAAVERIFFDNEVEQKETSVE